MWFYLPNCEIKVALIILMASVLLMSSNEQIQTWKKDFIGVDSSE